MKTRFPLFQGHLDLAHSRWQQLITPEDSVIDATCGNGHDLLTLLSMGAKKVWAFDIQQKALDSARARCHEHLDKITFVHGCHTELPQAPVKLVVYNLGYLPGADKQITTQTTTTLRSIELALSLVVAGGGVSITVYPGHPEGQREKEQLLAWANQLCPQRYQVCHHTFCNRKKAPEWLWIGKGFA